ncbi:MAG: beta-lactamase family protein [Chitinophagaceae bacterium]|nr:beta-lactamase family protein [Chitinophagaceae bacterium]
MKKSILFLLLMPLILQAQTLKETELDKIVKEAFAQQKVAGASVLIAQNGKIILNKGYGFAHLGFGIPATPQTKYFIVGGNTTVLGAAMMQLVEKGALSPDDEITKYLPGFNVQGHKITIRHLLTSTSGLPDYHYLGDPLTGQAYQPKAIDEVVDLFENKLFTMKPGTKFDWSISNFALLVSILQKVTNQRYEDYLKTNIITPLGLQETEYLTQKKLIPHFAQGYQFSDGSFYPATESLLKYDLSTRLVSTTGDMYKLWEGLKQGKVISRKSFMQMTSREEAAKNNSGNFGYMIFIPKLENYNAMSFGGNLDGYSSALYVPDKEITIIIFTNSSETNAGFICRQIARKMLGLPPPPITEVPKKIITDLPLTKQEQLNMAGTYIVKRTNIDSSSPLTFNMWKRTIRVFTELEQLMMQRFGELPEPLLKQADGAFAIRSSPQLIISFKNENNNAVLSITSPGSYIESGARIGNADVKTFHGAAFENLK